MLGKAWGREHGIEGRLVRCGARLVAHELYLTLGQHRALATLGAEAVSGLLHLMPELPLVRGRVRPEESTRCPKRIEVRRADAHLGPIAANGTSARKQCAQAPACHAQARMLVEAAHGWMAVDMRGQRKHGQPGITSVGPCFGFTSSSGEIMVTANGGSSRPMPPLE